MYVGIRIQTEGMTACRKLVCRPLFSLLLHPRPTSPRMRTAAALMLPARRHLGHTAIYPPRLALCRGRTAEHI